MSPTKRTPSVTLPSDDLTGELASARLDNARLLTEAKETRERHAAVLAVLAVLGGSGGDPRPVFNLAVTNAAGLSGANGCLLWLQDGDVFRLAAWWQEGELWVEGDPAVEYFRQHQAKLVNPGITGRVYRAGTAVQVADMFADPDYPKEQLAYFPGIRTVLGVPLVNDGKVTGVLSLGRRAVRPFSDHDIALVQAFADQAAIAIQNARLFNETNEALERQAAISEVLAAIGRAGFDPQPVFDLAIAHAGRLCGANGGSLWLRDGDLFRMTAGWTLDGTNFDAARDYYQRYPGAVNSPGITGRVYRAGASVQIPDVTIDPEYPKEQLQYLAGGMRTLLGVPLLKDRTVVGVLSLARRMVKPFSDHDIGLVRTFADQAVLAIENARLLNETKAALERQTATGEVLKVISRSAFDLQRVLDTVVESAATLCGADVAWITSRSSEQAAVSAVSSGFPADLREPALKRLRDTGGGYAARAGQSTLGVMQRLYKDAATVHVADLEDEPELRDASPMVRAMGGRTVLAVPVRRDNIPIAGIVLARRQVRPFSDGEIQLAETFADQASIAIENVRLFKETKESLEQQTATGEVLKVISRSAFDLQRVLDTVISSAVKLTNGATGTIFRLEGDEYRFAATSNPDGPVKDVLERMVVQPEQDTVLTRSARSGRPVQVEDVQTEPGFETSPSRGLTNTHTRLAVPLLREGVPIGVLVIGREDVRLFSDKEIELVVSFADQAVIAIENTRLLTEIQEKSQQLAAASQHKSEFMANMSHELRTPLNAIIGFSDVLEQRLFGELNERQADYTRDIASSGRHLLDLVNEILDLSKVEAGRMELEPTEFAMADTIHGALAFVRERAASHRIGLTADVPPDLGTVVADERKVRQVLLNLLSNAVKFTPDGGTIRVLARRGDGEVEVSVRDTGIGIAPEDQAKVFDEFQQVGEASDRSREGTGLGLTLAKRFIELHGGRIWIESEVGKGTTFTFAIPVAATATQPA